MMAFSNSEKTSGLVLILFISFVQVRLQTPSPPRTAKFGEACDYLMACDVSASLACYNGTCLCETADMHYDRIEMNCDIKVGAKCRYQLEPDNSYYGYYFTGYGAGYEELSCVPNSICNRLGVCTCTRHFIELPDGTCLEKGSYEGRCNTDRECRQDKFLRCINGRCSCDEASLFCPVQQQCVGKADQPCVGKNRGCVRFADCDSVPIAIPEDVNPRSRRKRKHHREICVCQPFYVGDSSGECRVGLGAQCSDENECAEFFNCREGKCICPYEDLQIANFLSQTCTSLVGGPCNETVATELQPQRSYINPVKPVNPNSIIIGIRSPYRNYQCVEHAYCVANNDDIEALSQCACEDGFIENKEGTCDLAFGSKCNSGSVSEYRDVLKRGRRFGVRRQVVSLKKKQNVILCDRSAPLTCVNGFCQCESDLYEYDGKGSCLGKHGARCYLPVVEYFSSNNTNLETIKGKCVEGANCVPVRELSPNIGRCVCTSGNANSERRCND